MPTEHSPEVKFEIGHVLFIDVVGYSKLPIRVSLSVWPPTKTLTPRFNSRLDVSTWLGQDYGESSYAS